MPATLPTVPAAPTPTEALAAKIARIEQLAAENAADWRPSFVAMLAGVV